MGLKSVSLVDIAILDQGVVALDSIQGRVFFYKIGWVEFVWTGTYQGRTSFSLNETSWGVVTYSSGSSKIVSILTGLFMNTYIMNPGDKTYTLMS